MTSKAVTVKPGAKVQDSGIYHVPGRNATMVKGEPAPPTPKAGQVWKQIVDTNSKNNKK